tara:strand:+ start:454 stop:1869 length:1416 start_codon:yes stop_codon:yes gene_type:complete
MKRYDLHRLVIEQLIPGGNPGAGGGSQGGGKGKSGDLRLVKNIGDVRKPSRPEIGQDDRRPVNPSDIFADLLANIPGSVLVELEVLLSDGNIDDALALLLQQGAVSQADIDLIEQHLLNFDPDNFDYPEGSIFSDSGGLLTALILTRIFNRSENGFMFFMNQLAQEAFMEYLFTQGIMNAPEDVFGNPDEYQSYIEQFLADWVNTQYISENAAQSIIEFFELLLTSPGDAEVPLPSIGDLFSFLSFQNYSTLTQPLMATRLFMLGQNPAGVGGAGSWWVGKNSARIFNKHGLLGSRGLALWERRWKTWLAKRAAMTGLAGFFGSAGTFGSGILLTLVLELAVIPLVAAAGATVGELIKATLENRINGDPNLWLLMVELGLVRPAGYQYGNPENGVVNNEFEYGYGLYTLLSLVPGLGETLEFISFTVPEYLMDIWNEITGGDPNWEPPVPGGYQGPITPPTYSPTQPTRQP